MKQLIVGAARGAGHAAMMPLEAALRRKARSFQSPAPPVFLIGPPRSGTTLFYEAMITRFRFAYISNAAHRFFRTPLAATRLARPAIEARDSAFSSSMGHIDGWAAPNEGGWNWKRWLPDGDWSGDTLVAEVALAELQSLTNGLSMVLDAPFLNKNVMHSNRLARMAAIWPDARFITVRRDVRANVRSIVKAERQDRGPRKDGQNWWSVRPSIAPEWLGRGDVERAVAQVVGTLADIARDAERLDSSRFADVEYELFCADPRKCMKTVRSFLTGTGGSPAPRNQLPKDFTLSPGRLLDDADEERIEQALAELSRSEMAEGAIARAATRSAP